MKNKKEKDIAELFVLKFFKLFHIKLKKQTEKLFVQIFKFIIVGGVATIIDFASIFVFKEYLHIPVLIANTLAFCIATVYNYIASIRWVFTVDESKNKKKTFVTFVVFSAIGLVLNDLIMWLTMELFNMYYILAKIVATCFVMVFNFITRKLFLEKVDYTFF